MDDLSYLFAKAEALLNEINAQKKLAGMSEKGRCLAIAATNIETASLYLKKANEVQS